jgi:hypothetical protein
MVQPDDAHSAWIVGSGWLDSPPERLGPQGAEASSKIVVAAYGQSFTANLVDDLAAADPGFAVRLDRGPSAPLNHSFKLYMNDRNRHDARVVVIGILASVFPELMTMTAMTSAFEYPYPYTYPRYSLVEGRLVEATPMLRSSDDLRVALANPVRWRAFDAELAAHDEAYSSLVFDEDVLDRSVLGRMFRRAVAQRNQRLFVERFHRPTGFINEDGLLDVAEAILAEFARTAWEDGRLPYVVLFNDFGYSNHLFTALAPRLTRHGIPFLSSHVDVPPDDRGSFGADEHIRPDLDLVLAARWAADLRRRLAEEAPTWKPPSRGGPESPARLEVFRQIDEPPRHPQHR